jgi:hypothetical protein
MQFTFFFVLLGVHMSAATASLNKSNTVTYSWYDSYPPVKASASMYVSIAMDANQTATTVDSNHNTLPEHTTNDAVTAIVVVTPTVAFTRCSEHACPESRGTWYYIARNEGRKLLADLRV